MARYAARDDYEDEDEEDPGAPDRADQDPDDADDDVDTRECAGCGADVYEFAERCPKCGEYASREAPGRRRTNHPRWVVATAVLLLVLLVYGAVRWGF